MAKSIETLSRLDRKTLKKISDAQLHEDLVDIEGYLTNKLNPISSTERKR